MRILSHILVLFCSVSADSVFAAGPDYWVDYTLTESVRRVGEDTWKVFYSEPYGARVGYGVGYVASERHSDDRNTYDCYKVEFSPRTANELVSLVQTIEVSSYVGDLFCTPKDAKSILRLLTLKTAAIQGKPTTILLPFLAGREVKIELVAKWKVGPLSAPSSTP